MAAIQEGKSIITSFDQQMGKVQIDIPVIYTDNETSPSTTIKLIINRKDINDIDNRVQWSQSFTRGTVKSESTAVLSFYDISAPLGKEFKYDIYITSIGNFIQEQCIITDDIYLQDTEGLFKIKFNPDITGYKRVLGDSLTQTLGSKYPFFRRNGNMDYKQFNIGGLISYHMNENYSFSDSLPSFNNTIEEEFYKERLFRDSILDFLYSDKEKLLRSTTEGNMLIRLTNVSLTPNKQLGRMIYSFSAQATEVADPSMKNYKFYGQQSNFVNFGISDSKNLTISSN